MTESPVDRRDSLTRRAYVIAGVVAWLVCLLLFISRPDGFNLAILLIVTALQVAAMLDTKGRETL